MSLIPVSYAWPTLSNWQVQFQGTAASPVQWGPVPIFIQSKGMEGFDLPATRTGDTNRPLARGEFIGLDLFSGRDLTLTFDVGGNAFGSYSNLAAALTAIRQVTNTADNGDIEYPLFVQFPNMPLLGIMARARKRSFNPTLAMSVGNLAQNYTLQFHATDPFFYTQTQTAVLGLPTPASGFTFPVTFPLSFGSGSEPAIVPLANTGDVECYPLLTVTGPCTYPAITNLSLSGDPLIQFGVTMNSGDKLIIDTDLKTATYFPLGSAAGFSVMSTIQQGWNWWSMPPGTNSIQFSSTDDTAVAGSLTINWASAYSSAV